MNNSPTEMFANAVISGWIIASMVWMFPSAGAAKIWVIIIMTYLVAIGDLTHIVVGSVEILYLIFSGHLHWQAFLYPFALPTLAGNIIGGTFIFALISHAQIRNELDKSTNKIGVDDRHSKGSVDFIYSGCCNHYVLENTSRIE